MFTRFDSVDKPTKQLEKIVSNHSVKNKIIPSIKDNDFLHGFSVLFTKERRVGMVPELALGFGCVAKPFKKENTPPLKTPFDNLLDALDDLVLEVDCDGSITSPCRGCGEQTPINCHPLDLDMKSHYCGKNRYCMP